MQPTRPHFVVTFGEAIALELAAAGIDPLPPVYCTARGAVHYSRLAPYNPDALTARAGAFVASPATARGCYYTAQTDAAPDLAYIAAYGADMPPRVAPIPHADSVTDVTDCTDWLNRIAARALL